MRPRPRSILLALPTSLLVLSLTGCISGEFGTTGLSRTAAGGLSLVITWCDHPMDRVLVGHDVPAATPDDPSGTSSVHDITFAPVILTDPDQHDGGFTEIPLDLPTPSGWTAKRAGDALKPGTRYWAEGVAAGNGYGTRQITFVPADQKALKAGTVLVPDQDGVTRSRVVTRADFQASGRRTC